MNFKGSQALAQRLISKNGIKVVLKRDGVDVAKSMGVFVNATNNDFDGSGSAPITGLPSGQRICLIAGNIKIKPEINDVLSCVQGTFSILEVDLVQPGAIPILFKVRLQK